MRTQKTVDGVTTEYYTVGGKLLAEKTGDRVLTFYYDDQGAPVSVELNGTRYYYHRNLQGDVIGLYSTTGAVVAEYTYDPWGKLLSVTDTSGTDIGALNPLRYRGYYYDTETGFYFLQSRYYDPTVGRFINADGELGANNDILSYNLFAYCSDDPINHSDPTGKGIFGDFARSFYDVWIKPYVDRNSAMFNDPNLYNIGNWLTCGFFDTVKGAIAPQKPLSLQHWVDSFCVASVVMGPFIANAGRGARAAKSASATTKSIGTPFDPKGAKVQVGVDPNTLKINRPLLPAKMEAIRREAQAYGGINRAVEVWRSGVIYDGNHRVAYAQQIGATVDVIIFPQ